MCLLKGPDYGHSANKEKGKKEKLRCEEFWTRVLLHPSPKRSGFSINYEILEDSRSSLNEELDGFQSSTSLVLIVPNEFPVAVI